MTVIEAMACGLPVIVTENTGAKSAVIDGENGFIIPINDLEVLKSKIRFFYNQAEVIKKIGERAEKNIRELSIENYANSIGKIIEEIQLNK
jgi:glycosyltransferase involved in cell wall biosynthesis